MDDLEKRINNINNILSTCSERPFDEKINYAVKLIVTALKSGLPLLICGNGGSAADAQHIAGELVGKFLKERKALNVRSLTTDTSILTAWGNDCSFETIFSRQVEAYGRKDAILLAISTSGQSKNILEAVKAAKDLDMNVISLTGDFETEITKLSTVNISAPTKETPRIQEVHLVLYHYICEKVENEFV